MTVLWEQVLGAGHAVAHRVRRDTMIRLDDPEGDACVHLLSFNAHDPSERFNPADTMKIPWQAYVGQGTLLLSDMGRILLTMIDDTSGRHDVLCGGSNRADNERRYGAGSVGSSTPNARDLMAIAGARLGLVRADIGPCLNLFKQAVVAKDGSISLIGGVRPGGSVSLRAEMDLVVVLANTPHRLDDRSAYTATPVRVSAHSMARPAPDPFRGGSGERERLFENTEAMVAEVSA
jgi:urea carboxylase-associated protein 2